MHGLKMNGQITKETASLAAKVRMSVQETVEGHAFSNSLLMLSITSNPLTEFRFGNEFFSPLELSVSSNSTDPSQPCMFISCCVGQSLTNQSSTDPSQPHCTRLTLTMQSWKCRRTSEAAILVSLLIADQTFNFTIIVRLGQVLSQKLASSWQFTKELISRNNPKNRTLREAIFFFGKSFSVLN